MENGSSNSKVKSLLTSENLNRINARHHNNNNINNNNNSENVHNVNKTLNMNDLLEDENDDDIDESDEHQTEQTNELRDEDIVDGHNNAGDNVDGETSIKNKIDDVTARLNDDPGIQSLMEISLPSPMPIHAATDECTCTIAANRKHPNLIYIY